MSRPCSWVLRCLHLNWRRSCPGKSSPQRSVMFALSKRFELGTYLHYSGRPITERGTTPTDGLWTHLVSVGPAAKVPFALATGSRIRVSAMLGYNRVWQGFENGTFEGTITGQGPNFSASIEYSRDLAPGNEVRRAKRALTRRVIASPTFFRRRVGPSEQARLARVWVQLHAP